MTRARTGSFGGFVERAHDAGRLVVQPRMGMSDPAEMRRGLLATRRADAVTVGTVTLDSYTRVGDHRAAREALRAGAALNGYPIVAHDLATTRAMLDGAAAPDFPVQVRHGSAAPHDIFSALIEAGLDATEGGPISYCLPYSRRPLRESVREWARCSELFAELRGRGREPHLETFGGCMLGQLCPPGLLVAISLLEGLFFHAYGIRSISLSYAQQTNQAQDVEAVRALRRLAAEFLADADRHVVVYAYMGVYPRTTEGALDLLADAARLAVRSGAARLIVKTSAEAHRIPTVEENVAALETAAGVALETAAGTSTREAAAPAGHAPDGDTGVYQEARTLVDAVLDLHPRIDQALLAAFTRGYLDVPFCLHPDNAGRTRSRIDDRGRLRWSETGALPIALPSARDPAPAMGAGDLLDALSFVSDRFDAAALERSGAAPLPAAPLPAARPPAARRRPVAELEDSEE